jgi:hypothetical protein
MTFQAINLADITEQTKDSKKYNPVPEGLYTLRITNVNILQGKESGADYIKWEFTIVDEDNSNTKVWENMSLTNDYSLHKLKALCSAVNFNNSVFYPNDLNSFIGKVCQGYLYIKISTDYPDQNVIKYFQSCDMTGNIESKLQSKISESDIPF